MKKVWIILGVLGVILLGILVANVINSRKENDILVENIIENNIDELSEKVTDECTQEWENLERQAQIDIEANSSEEKISPTGSMTLKKYYKQCEHTINEYIDIPQELVNKTKNDLQEEYENWEIQQFSSNNIILYREFDSSCGQHYILRNNNGKITIYLVNENNEEELYENTEISIEYLTDKDKEEIEKGIRVNGKEELYQKIEDFE